MNADTIRTLILLVLPILIVQFGLVIYALLDLAKRSQVHGPRWVWAVFLVLCAFAVPSGIIVSGLYLIWGRHGEVQDDPH